MSEVPLYLYQGEVLSQNTSGILSQNFACTQPCLYPTPVLRNQEIKSQQTSWQAIAQQPLKSSHCSQELLPRGPTHLEICCAAVMLVPRQITWNLRGRSFPQCVIGSTDTV